MGLFSPVKRLLSKFKVAYVSMVFFVKSYFFKLKKYLNMFYVSSLILIVSYASYSLYRAYGPSADYDVESQRSAFLSLITMLIYLIYKYYFISVIAFKSKFTLKKVFKALGSLAVIFFTWIGVFIAGVSMCLAFIPELTVWNFDVIQAALAWEHNPASIKFVKSLLDINVFNATVALIVLTVISYFCYFGIVTSAIIYAKTHRFTLSLLGAPRFMVMNKKMYLCKLLPLTIISFIFLCYGVYIGWLVSIPMVYLICEGFKGKKLI
ncbi:hypothetical protein [Pseudomonas extremaustralis]